MDLWAGNTPPKQLVVTTTRGGVFTRSLPNDSSTLVYPERKALPAGRAIKSGVQAMPIAVGPFFQSQCSKAEGMLPVDIEKMPCRSNVLIATIQSRMQSFDSLEKASSIGTTASDGSFCDHACDTHGDSSLESREIRNLILTFTELARMAIQTRRSGIRITFINSQHVV